MPTCIVEGGDLRRVLELLESLGGLGRLSLKGCELRIRLHTQAFDPLVSVAARALRDLYRRSHRPHAFWASSMLADGDRFLVQAHAGPCGDGMDRVEAFESLVRGLIADNITRPAKNVWTRLFRGRERWLACAGLRAGIVED